jgi:hypothetical protein
MKTLLRLLAASLLFSLASHAQPGAFREPRRVIGNRQFDLTLLFNWWENPSLLPAPNENATNKFIRPLPGWFKVTAAEIRDGGSVWIIKGTLNSSRTNSAPCNFCLFHPPINERAAFLAALNQRADASAHHQRAAFRARADSESASQYAAQSSQLNYLRRNSEILYWDLADASAANDRAYHRARSSAELARADAADALERERSAAALLANFKNQTTYEFDHFVCATGQTYNGLPVFDTGLIGH